jgi:hypothetical protein
MPGIGRLDDGASYGRFRPSTESSRTKPLFMSVWSVY